MGRDFLSARLVTSKRFQPTTGEASASESDTTAPAEPESASANADQYRKLEEERIHHTALRHEATETIRRREELLVQLREALDRIEAEQHQLQSQGALFREKVDTLTQLPSPRPASPDLSVLRELRQEVHATHMELAKFAQQAAPNPERAAVPANLSFRELSGIGFAMTWPLMLAVVLGGLLVALGVVAAFRF